MRSLHFGEISGPAHFRVRCEDPQASMAKRALSNQFIIDTLSHYESEGIAIVSAEWDKKSLLATARNLPYPFTKPGHINYMTAAMAALYVSQASYLNARLLIHDNLLPPGTSVSDDDFLLARDQGSMVFRNMSFQFNKKIAGLNSEFTIRQTMFNYRAIRRYLFANFHCIMNDGACLASGVFLMPRRHE